MDLELLADGLDREVISRLKEKSLTLTTTESLTGGLVGAVLTTVPGASAVYKQGFITYCNEAKHRLVGVSEETLEVFGAVSEQTAVEMAEGAALRTGSDVSVSLTGNAGPSAEEGKPVGLVYIGCSYHGNTKAGEYLFQGNRMQVRTEAVKAVLRMILDCIG